jgi:hypothetical protein
MRAGPAGRGATDLGSRPASIDLRHRAPDIENADCPINFIEAIHAQNENIGIALRLFCEKRRMNRSIAISESEANPGPTGADAAQWVEIYFPGVEDLLRRLVRGQADRRKMVRSLLFGSRTMVTTCVICFICVPGCATAAMFLMKPENFRLVPAQILPAQILPVQILPVQLEQGSARANRLPLIQPIHHFGEARPSSFAEISNKADSFEPDPFESAALRGSIENVPSATPLSSPSASSPSASSPPPENPRKSRHSANRSTAAKPIVETPQPEPRLPSPSLFEKLFGVRQSVPQSQRQT